MDKLDCMRAFAAVAAQSSFTSGARQLGISTKLASKYVARLEEQLGAQLLNRTTRKVTLTDTGRAYLERCLPLLAQFDELEDVVQLRQQELAGPIRITAPTGFGSRELVEALQPFQQAHPKVLVELVLSDRHLPMLEEGVDLAVRFGALKDSTLVARKLCGMRLVVVASPGYLATHGEPAEPEALATHNCLLQMTSPQPDAWVFGQGAAQRTVTVRGSFRANSPRAVAHMAASGLGIARCPHYTALPFLRDGRLQVLFEQQETDPATLYAVYPSSRHLTARIRALIDHLAGCFGQGFSA
ncbi:MULTISPECIES: LysR family transcriptional regulator [unclassified Leisingera]|uniref:LysR family transcriptional regulator n=1 Tax=unclassified Leisingera TaxID=2614906 RepID=UPI0002F15BDE|nr:MULTISPECIES: LysR family transcriptional regulator [unclassified Leisingera]KIC26826.1 LysR family transcriptional regulator [Leisingera sp. ANG-S3]KIC49491.1 LysR family transcriptional regulator [Leisingera sp. ANG-S]KID07107.1 LysR family transcriptional regulator [Leisingera sp. ANG1]